MNLYLLTQEQAYGYDTYDSCVVCAASAENAAAIRPDSESWSSVQKWREYEGGSWAYDRDAVKVQLIGLADPSVPAGVVIASFNAG